MLVFGVMIFIHELGHYLSARACGVGVNEFAIGMGPKILSRVSKKSGIRYSLRLLPIGGFVSMVGEDEESEAENAFGRVGVIKRMIIIVSGAFMNIVLGFLIMLVIVSAGDAQDEAGGRLLATNQIREFNENAVSFQSGLQKGDVVIKIGRTRIHNGYDLSYEIMNQGYDAVDITVKRGGEKVVLENVIFATFQQSGAVFGEMDFKVYGKEITVGSVLYNTWFRSLSTIKMIWDSLTDLIGGRYGIEAVSGPVGITEQIGDAAKTGLSTLLYICAVITINLGVVNLLPLPALDGGRLLFLIIEAVRGKPVKKEVEGYIHFIGIILLFGLMLLITFKDVWSIFTR